MKQSLYHVLAFPELFCVYPRHEYQEQQQQKHQKTTENEMKSFIYFFSGQNVLGQNGLML